jgi:hypothetical protein
MRWSSESLDRAVWEVGHEDHTHAIINIKVRKMRMEAVYTSETLVPKLLSGRPKCSFLIRTEGGNMQNLYQHFETSFLYNFSQVTVTTDNEFMGGGAYAVA